MNLLNSHRTTPQTIPFCEFHFNLKEPGQSRTNGPCATEDTTVCEASSPGPNVDQDKPTRSPKRTLVSHVKGGWGCPRQETQAAVAGCRVAAGPALEEGVGRTRDTGLRASSPSIHSGKGLDVCNLPLQFSTCVPEL